MAVCTNYHTLIYRPKAMLAKIGKTYYRYSWKKKKKKLSGSLIEVYTGEVFSLLHEVEFNRTHISPSVVRLLTQTVLHIYIIVNKIWYWSTHDVTD